MEVTYVENSRELRNTIYKIPRPYDKHGVCSWCGKELESKRWKWCRDKRDKKKYGKCVSLYLAQKGYYKSEVIRRNRLKYDKALTCESCKTPIRKLKIPKGDVRFIYDHIKPIALGGSPTNPDNIQILCIFCNKIKTRNDIEEIANQRRFIKEERVRVKREERLNGVFGKKSRWSSITEFSEVKAGDKTLW